MQLLLISIQQQYQLRTKSQKDIAKNEVRTHAGCPSRGVRNRLFLKSTALDHSATLALGFTTIFENRELRNTYTLKSKFSQRIRIDFPSYGCTKQDNAEGQTWV